MFHRAMFHWASKITPKYVYTMHVHQLEAEKENRERFRRYGYIVSLSKDYFEVEDLAKMLGIKSKGRHKLPHSLKTLVSQKHACICQTFFYLSPKMLLSLAFSEGHYIWGVMQKYSNPASTGFLSLSIVFAVRWMVITAFELTSVNQRCLYARAHLSVAYGSCGPL